MPDPTKATLSATQTPGLFGVSPYVTKWLLWHHFARGVEIDPPEDGRMSWGKKLQPLIIQQAAEDLKLEVHPNADDTYHRRGLLGCTRDATIICPDRGPGALETKCVFDYRTWMSDWDGGKNVPKHYDIQLQQQMHVADGRGEPYQWGVLAVWVAGDVHYFERQPIAELWENLKEGAHQFFADVQAGREPDPFGVAIEAPWLVRLLPTVKGAVLDLSNDGHADGHAETARLYWAAKQQESAAGAVAEELRPKLLALAKEAEEIWLPGPVHVRIRAAGKGKRVTVYEPEQSKGRVPDDLLMAG